jgi:peptidyl-prolyl cis-trans isomerase B (cyclophilin B)
MKAKLQTNHGDILIALDREKAPTTVDNFVAYVASGFYDGTLFHRVIDNFMIQGGGYLAGMEHKPTNAPIKNEADNGLRNLTGTIAMARTSNPHSASSQFFINVSDNGFLDHTAPTSQGWGYCVFGSVVEGMEVVNAIKSAPTTSRHGMQDVPVDDVVIMEATLLEDA